MLAKVKMEDHQECKLRVCANHPIAPPAKTSHAELTLNRNTTIALINAIRIVNQSTSASRASV